MNNPKKYRISKEALNDLKSIWKYTSLKWSVDQANRYFQLIIDEIEYLSEHSKAGKSVDF